MPIRTNNVTLSLSLSVARKNKLFVSLLHSSTVKLAAEKMEGLRFGWTLKVLILIIFSSILFRCVSSVTNHSVGGATGWDLTSDLKAWSSSNVFYAGDFLVFIYGPIHDVLEVNQKDFAACRTINPIITHNDGETVVPLTEEGRRYFICGRIGHCSMGLKLSVKVLSSPNGNVSAPGPNSTQPVAGGSSSKDRGHGRGGNKRPIPPPSRRLPPPPPPSPLSKDVPAPPDHEEHAGRPNCIGCSGTGKMTKAGLVYPWLAFTTLVILT